MEKEEDKNVKTNTQNFCCIRMYVCSRFTVATCDLRFLLKKYGVSSRLVPKQRTLLRLKLLLHKGESAGVLRT